MAGQDFLSAFKNLCSRWNSRTFHLSKVAHLVADDIGIYVLCLNGTGQVTSERYRFSPIHSPAVNGIQYAAGEHVNF